MDKLEKFSYLPPTEFIEAVENRVNILDYSLQSINEKWLNYVNNYNKCYTLNLDYYNETENLKRLVKENKDKFNLQKMDKKQALNGIMQVIFYKMIKLTIHIMILTKQQK